MEVYESIWKYKEVYGSTGNYMKIKGSTWKVTNVGNLVYKKLTSGSPPPLAKGQLFQPKFTNLMST